MHMLVVHATLQPKSAVLMHRGLWRMDVLKSMPAAIARGAEARIECDNKVRFAALARVPLAEIAWMVAKLSAFEAIIPLFLKSDVPMDETAASRLANAAFPPGGCADRSDLDWANFARHIVSIGGICARWSSDLSVPEVALDLFLADAEAQRVRAILDEAH